MLSKVQKTKKHLYYEVLQRRQVLTNEEEFQLRSLQLGYEGEVKFAQLINDNLFADHIVIYGMLLDNQGSIIQIDCYLIMAETMIIIEVKNYQGEFTLMNDNFSSLTSQKHYPNPLHQTQRTESNLRNIFLRFQFNLPVQSFVVFVNNEFTLYADKHEKIILPTQLNSFFRTLNKNKSKLTNKHYTFAKQLSSLHLTDNPMERLPQSNYQSLQKGVRCFNCGKSVLQRRYYFHCNFCYKTENFDSAILRNAIELNFLLPDKPITVNNLWTWMGYATSSTTIRRVLKFYLKKENKTKNTKYQLENRLSH